MRSLRSRALVPLFASFIFQFFVFGPAFSGVMDLDGKFSVSEGGDATYTLPLTFSPGIGGVEPKLSITYNSQAGNGFLGVGWSLSGLSVITRCPSTVAQDGVKGSITYTLNNDRFCMDGQRLIKIAGTSYGADGAEYRTERESFSKVVSYGAAGAGPASFKVWTKAGQVLEYGGTTDSRIEAQGKTSVRIWALNKVSDTKGNYYSISYAEDSITGEYYPVRIDYTGNSTASVVPNSSTQFVYEARPDILQAYFAGASIKTTQRLKSIQGYVGSAAIKEYRIDYQTSGTTGRSRIAKITECEFTSNTCKPSLLPTWTERALAFSEATNWTSGAVSFFADVNGDGRADLIQQRSDGLYVSISNGSGVGASTKWINDFGSGQGYTDSNITPIFVADINADGLADVVAFSDNANKYAYVALSNGSSFNSPTSLGAVFTKGAGWTSMENFPRTLADINGDGRPDIVGFKDTAVYAALNTGGGLFAAPNNVLSDFGTATATKYTSNLNNPRVVIDVNGDGFADIVGISDVGVYVALSYGGTSFRSSTKWLSDFSVGAGWTSQDFYPRTVGDVNGDGLPDLIGFKSDGTYVALNTGSSFLSPVIWASDFGSSTSTPYTTQKAFPRYVIDVNGDGRADVVGFSQNGVQVALSTGTGFSQTSQWVNGFGAGDGFGATELRQLIDLDGDGAPDVVGVKASGVTVALGARTGPPDMITSLAFGLGTRMNVTYRPLTDPSVYTRGFGASYPLADVTAPVYVVASAKYPNGLGDGYTTTNYRYGSLRADYQGRGFLGLGWFEATQVETNITTRTDFRQDWPYVGLPSRVTKFFSGESGFLGVTSNTYACLNPLNGNACSIAAGNGYFPYVSKTIEAAWDANGAELPVVTTTNTFDKYGNPTAVRAAISDGTSKTTSSIFTNDVSNWFLGRLTRTTVSSVTGATPGTKQNGLFYFNPVIAANVNNYNVKSAAIAAGWDQVSMLIATVTVNSGITVGSATTTQPAFDTGANLPMGTRLALVNNGSIIGRGGNGAGGASITTTTWTAAAAGNGGAGLSTTLPISVTNNGVIAGGGGGGGGGSGYKANIPWPIGSTTSRQTAFAGSSGGGGGAGGSTGGVAGVASGTTFIVSGAAGGAGTATSPGTGGGTAACWQYATLRSNAGGTGGELGQPGSSGDASYSVATIPGATQFGSVVPPPAPGQGGPAVLNNIYVNWVATGSRLGQLR